MGKSKYETMEEAMKKQVESFDNNVDDRVQEKRLRAQLERLQTELNHEIREIQSTPIDKELLKRQAKTELESQMNANARIKKKKLQEAEDVIKIVELRIKNLKAEYEAQIAEETLGLEKQKNMLTQVQEICKEEEERANMRAKQEHDRALSSVENSEVAISLKVEKATQKMEEHKQEIQIRLDTLKAKNDAQDEKLKCWKALYDDIKAIGLSIGDGQK